jgi:hypothetical protein
MNKMFAISTALMLGMGASLAQSGDTDLLRCRQISDASQRLRCYDALPLASASAPVAAAPARTPAPAGAPAAPGQPPAAAAAAANPGADNFGLEGRGAGARVDMIESAIVGKFEEWGPSYRFNLANGQVWQVMDGSSGFRASADPKVKIRRGMLGAFYLELVGTNRSPRVQRVQ